MHMMPPTAPCTSVSMHFAHVGGARGASVRNSALYLLSPS